MKKALVVLLALAVVGVMGFADTKWSVSSLYGFGFYMPSTGTELVPYDYSQVGSGRVRLSVKLTSDDGNVGFNGRFQDTANATGTGTLNVNRFNGWAKLFDGMLTVRAGILDDYTIATADWDGFGNTDGKVGMYFNVAPMAGLDIGFFQVIPTAAVGASANGDIVGLAFSLPDLVAIQAGVALDFTNTATTGHAIYFGANVKAVKDLTAIVEGQVQLCNGNTPMTFVENVGYAMGALTVGVRAGQYLSSTPAQTDWGLEPTVSYKVNDNVTVNAIVNVYSYQNSIHNVSFMSPLDSYGTWAPAAGATNTINFGGGASVNWIMGGATLTVGDFYAAATGAGNLFYVNFDVSL